MPRVLGAGGDAVTAVRVSLRRPFSALNARRGEGIPKIDEKLSRTLLVGPAGLVREHQPNGRFER